LLAQGRNPATKLLHLLRNFLSRFHELCKTENLGRTFDQVRHPEQRPALSVVEWVEGEEVILTFSRRDFSIAFGMTVESRPTGEQDW